MSSEYTYQDGSTIYLDSKPYRIARDRNGALQYQTDYQNEPPWDRGSPALGSEPASTWHNGGLKSRQGIPGTTEYGVNTDCRWPLQILPGPKINTYTLTSSPGTPAVVCQGLGYIWVFSGAYGWRIDSAGTVTTSKTNFDANPVNALMWNDAIYITRNNRNVWRCRSTDIVGGGPDSWSEGTNTVEAIYLAKSSTRLFKMTNEAGEIYRVKNLALGLDVTDETAWGDSLDLAKGTLTSASMVAYDRTVIVSSGDDEGLHGVHDDGSAVPIARRLRPAGKLKFIEPWIYVPHNNGLARFVPGLVESIGLEKELMNDSIIRGYIAGVTMDGAGWLYIAVWDGTNSHILVGREARGSEPSLGPIIWDTLFQTSTLVEDDCFQVLNNGNNELLVFNHGNDLGYVIIPFTGGSPPINHSSYQFAVAGTRFTYRYDFGDRGEKDFPKIRLKGSGLDANTYWDIAYSIDGAAFATVDINGANMRLNSNSLTTFYLPTTAHGVEIQFRFTYVGASAASAGRITYFEPYFIPRPKTVPVVAVSLELETGVKHEFEIDSRTPLEQLNDLEALVENATPVTARGPWNTSAVNANVRQLKVNTVGQAGNNVPTFGVSITIQEREQA